MVQRIATQIAASKQKEDGLANLVGHFGKWQLLVCASVSLVKFSSGWVQMAILFLTPNLVFWCEDFGPNSTEVAKNSTCYDHCLKYAYDTSPFENTIISEWDLVCKKAWMASFTQMVLQLGVLIGSIMFGFLSDRYGRKITFLVSITSLIILGFGVPFSPNYIVFTVVRFFLGVATAGTMVISFVLIMETIGTKYREIFGCLFQIPFIIGHMTVPLFAYYFRKWDEYSLALAVPPLIYLGYFFVLNESPRWLVSVGRVEEATKIVTKAAEMNGLPTAKIGETLKQMSEEINCKADEPKLNYSALFHPALRVKTVCCCAMWMITGLTFFGFNQYISQTSPDPFISVAAAGGIQIPSNLVSIWLIKHFGRKLTTATFFALGGICVVTLGCVPHTFWITLTLGTLGVSCTAIVAASIYIFTSELFPTVVRNMSMGASSTSMRVGSMIAPFISNLSLTIPWLPTVIFGVAPIAAGAVCLMLPETKGTTLPDSMEDIKNAG
ncbi:organic cation transporter protein-like [Epargyreus clarus]|uniref:organic cation transporter protein-like n=1 Tax=Epargyreus clarus TaxID=520877 RepID=UPI003C2B9269